MQIIKCENCGVEIVNISGRRKYCSKCRKIMDKKLRQIHDEKKKLLRLKNKQKGSI